MKQLTFRSIPVGIALGAAVFLTAGCDNDTTTPDIADDTPSSEVEDIDDAFGGYSRQAESPNFDDAYLASDEGEIAHDDPMADAPEVNTLLDDVTTDLYAVRLTWGYLERGDHPEDPVIEWDGSAAVNDGAVLGVRTLLFEPRTGDRIVRPRDSRLVLEWESTTTVASDGVQLLVASPQDAADNVLTVTAPQFSREIPVGDLLSLDEIVWSDDSGHEFRVQARKVELSAQCNRGWVSGRWQSPSVVDEPGDDVRGIRGRFRGHWVNAEGEVGGAMRGFYGVNARGNRVLFAKLIDENGNFRGLMRGTWTPSAERGLGSFRAVWMDIDNEVIGGVRGVYQRRADDGGGFFHGAWFTACDGEEDPVEVDDSIF